MLVRKSPGITVADIAAQMGLTRGKVSMHLGNLRSRGKVVPAGKQGRLVRWATPELVAVKTDSSLTPRALLSLLHTCIRAEATPRARIRDRDYIPLPVKECHA
ncbi:hypothetical protein DMP17_45035 [Pseudonocardia sp. TMWB2A]|uniref:winged helix-turn-helix domain-containing protein n=1 Tax=Pseudonocardia sp. TMWB2A TaxID=687430 RepID=UPI00307E0777